MFSKKQQGLPTKAKEEQNLCNWQNRNTIKSALFQQDRQQKGKTSTMVNEKHFLGVPPQELYQID